MGIVAAYVVPHPPLIVPAVGRGEERGIQSTIDAYEEVARRIAAHAPDALVVTSPHAPFLRDEFFLSSARAEHGSMARFWAPRERIRYECDTELASSVAREAKDAGVPVFFRDSRDGDLGEDHATFVPLYFVRGLLSRVRVVRAGLSMLSPEKHRAFGRCIAAAVDQLGRRVVLVASGDLSHKLKEDGPYGFAPEGPEFDREVARIFSEGDLEALFAFDGGFCERAAECGLRSFQVMAGALGSLSYTSELLSCEGPFGVGYAVAAFEVRDAADGDAADGDSADNGSAGSDSADGDSAGSDSANNDSADSDAAADDVVPDPYVALARASVEGYVRFGRLIEVPADVACELRDARAGVFVSLHKGAALRGCIGTISPCYANVAEEIVRNGIAAAARDPRFPPVTPDELDELSYSVDVLAPAEPVASEAELDPVRYGVIVSKGARRGLLLPNLEGVDTAADQVAIAKRKAGIPAFDDDVELSRFEVVRHTRGGEARVG